MDTILCFGELHMSITNLYKITVAKVIDGDTLDLTLDLGFSTIVEKRIKLHDLDAPEVFGVYASLEGQEAKRFVQDWIIAREDIGELVYQPIEWDTPDEGSIYFVGKGLDEYECLNEELLEKGYAIKESEEDSETSL